jgi:hypothetical protein
MEKLRQCLADLKAMTHSHALAVRASNILRFLMVHWHIEGVSEQEKLEYQDIARLCRPRSNSFNHFCPQFEEPPTASTLADPDDENPLFWPFPRQGRPLLDIKCLKEAGFYNATEAVSEAEGGTEKMDVS